MSNQGLAASAAPDAGVKQGDPLLEARGLCVDYPARNGQPIPALRDINLSLHPGEILTLIGPNGSGKSTLIRALLGHVAHRGEILWKHESLQRYNARRLARLVAYLPQNPTYQGSESVAQAIALGRLNYWGAFGLEDSQDKSVVESVAGEMQLQELLDRPMDSLSGGQRQRVLLARCLAQEPSALLLDEPGTFLDLKHQVEAMTLLRDLARNKGLAVLLASHDLNLAGAFADRIMVLADGSAAAIGSPEQVLQPELLTRVYGVKIVRVGGEGNVPMVAPVI